MSSIKAGNAIKQTAPGKFSEAFFLCSAFIILIVLPLFQKGTFIDGELYKTVAFNDAMRPGTFWSMKYTNTCMPFFCEQPPLYPRLLGCFYSWFGSSYLVDRCFTLFLLLIFLLLIKGIIKQLFAASGSYFSFFLFLMISVPVWCWSYVNQVIEPLVCVFSTLGIFSFLRWLSSGNKIFIALFALSCYCSFLSKGFQSCFIIVLPLIYLLVSGFSKKAFYFLAGGGFLFVAALVVTLKKYYPAMEWFDCYYNARLVLTLQNVGNTTDSHIEIIVRFFTELIVPFVFVIGLIVFLSVKKKYPVRFIFKNFITNKLAVSLMLTALAGSFPYAISLVQRGFYLVPSFICFLLAVLFGLKRYWLFFFAFISKMKKSKITITLTSVIFTGTLIYSCLTINSYKRDEKLLTDLALILPYISAKDTVLIEGNTWNYFSLHSYAYREKLISLTTADHNRKFFIRDRSSSQAIDSSYTNLHLPTKGLDLYIKSR